MPPSDQTIILRLKQAADSGRPARLRPETARYLANALAALAGADRKPPQLPAQDPERERLHFVVIESDPAGQWEAVVVRSNSIDAAEAAFETVVRLSGDRRRVELKTGAHRIAEHRPEAPKPPSAGDCDGDAS